jgi:uncharacterized protein (DUF2236 family)
VDLTGVDLTGPGTLHWRHAGDNRVLLLLVRAGLLQLMHPGLGAGVRDHSNFFGEPWERIIRSVPQIQGVTFDWPRDAATASKITAYHVGIKGVDERGRRYHALDPETYLWAHLTIFDTMIRAIELFDHRLSDAEKERFYAESLAAYRLYGVSDRIAPPDWAGYQRYLDRMCREVLELTPVAKGLLDFVERPPERLPLVPRPLYVLLRRPLGRFLWWVNRGTLHPALLERIGATWTARDERWLRIFAKIVHATWPLVPFRLRYSRVSRAAAKRVAGVR